MTAAFVDGDGRRVGRLGSADDLAFYSRSGPADDHHVRRLSPATTLSLRTAQADTQRFSWSRATMTERLASFVPLGFVISRGSEAVRLISINDVEGH